jgi:hypothetical protein
MTRRRGVPASPPAQPAGASAVPSSPELATLRGSTHADDPVHRPDSDAMTAIWTIGDEGRYRDYIRHPELRRSLESFRPRTVADLLEEIHRLRDALGSAIKVLAGKGYTPDAYRRLSEGEQRCEPWLTMTRLWKTAGVETEPRSRVVLRFTTDSGRGEHEYPTLQAAVEAAIAEVESGRDYPEGIDVDGRPVLDRSAILREWEERHDPD